MHLLFVHRNFPAQFGHIAGWLVENRGWQCTFISELKDATLGGVRRIQYKIRGGATRNTHAASRTVENFTWHSHAVYETLRRHPEITPDLIIGHCGFGSTCFLADLYDAPILNFFEWYYTTTGGEMDFRPEYPSAEEHILRARIRNAAILVDLESCTHGYSPTHWQRSRFPERYHDNIDVLFDGIDTDFWYRFPPPPGRTRWIGDRRIPADVKIVTYVSRGFESMRGFDIFMRVAKRICDARSDVIFVCAGSNRHCYGGDERFTGCKCFRDWVLAQDDYDLSRFIFTGNVSRLELVRLFGMSDLHIYLTVPFVLSWSLFNSLSCGCTVLGSRTPPVQEVIEHDRNGLLADFHDVDGLAELALRVLDDPESFRPLGQAGSQLIQDKYSMSVIMPEMLKLYDKTIEKYKTARAGKPFRPAHTYGNGRPTAIDANGGMGATVSLGATGGLPASAGEDSVYTPHSTLADEPPVAPIINAQTNNGPAITSFVAAMDAADDDDDAFIDDSTNPQVVSRSPDRDTGQTEGLPFQTTSPIPPWNGQETVPPPEVPRDVNMFDVRPERNALRRAPGADASGSLIRSSLSPHPSPLSPHLHLSFITHHSSFPSPSPPSPITYHAQPLRVLLAIAHYYRPRANGQYGSLRAGRDDRIAALQSCIGAWHELFGGRQFVSSLARAEETPANVATNCHVDVVVCTRGDDHLLQELDLPPGSWKCAPRRCPPMELGFECQALLRDQLGRYDYYGYLEDDLIVRDPLWFTKLRWFNAQAGEECLLQPYRYELSRADHVQDLTPQASRLKPVPQKVYIDGDLPLEKTLSYQDIGDRWELHFDALGQSLIFRRPLNPHAGCYFLTAAQLEHWSRQPHFLSREAPFYSPLESAATLGIMRTFRVYKTIPAQASFLEIQHHGDAWTHKLATRNREFVLSR